MFDAESALDNGGFIRWNLKECNTKKQVLNTILWQIKCDSDNIVSVHIYGDYIYAVKSSGSVITNRIVERG